MVTSPRWNGWPRRSCRSFFRTWRICYEVNGPRHRVVGSVEGTDTPSFDQFHQSRSRDAMRYATAILGREAAEHACQDAWLRTWRSWGAADPSRLDAWFFRIARNCSLDPLIR